MMITTVALIEVENYGKIIQGMSLTGERSYWFLSNSMPVKSLFKDKYNGRKPKWTMHITSPIGQRFKFHV